MNRASIFAAGLAMLGAMPLTARAQTAPVAPPARTTPPAVVTSTEYGILPGGTEKAPLFYYNAPFHPMMLHGGPVIRLRLNDKLNIACLFDTGSNAAILRPDVVSDLGLKVQKLELPNSKGGKPISVDKISLDTTNITSYIRFSSPEFRVDSRLFDVLNVVDPTVAGMLSVESFAGFSVLFDFETQMLSVIPASNLTAAQLTALGISQETPAIPMTTAGDPNMPEFSVTLRVKGDGDTYLEDSFVIDTGNERTLIVGDPARLKITPLMTSPRIDVEGESTNSVVVVNALQIVDPQHPSATVTLPHAECQFGTNPKKRNVRASNLGMDVLSHFRVLIDFPARKIYFAPLLHGNDLMYPTETARVCGERLIYDAIFKPSAAGQWTAYAIQPVLQGRGYFAAKGLQQGDVIVSVQGMKTDGLLPDELQRQIVHNLDKLTLTVLRDGKTVALP